ncbi:Uncharacterised protein [Achromobacter xylosoxidans]|nr:Uncharacterised protein [Achromobacter xylosoxidans]
MAVVESRPNTTLPLASLAEFSRCTVPRVVTDVVAMAAPCWRTSCPVSVMSPKGDWIRPVLAATPAWLPALRRADTSLPRVVERTLASDPRPRRMMKVSPAASTVWPLGVVIWPALWTSRPSSRT